MQCSNRHALVTGASTGMGRAIALSLGRRGFHVFATVRRQEDGEALQRDSVGCLTPVLMDVTNHTQITQAVEQVTAHAGDHGLDALVNNAGVALAWPLELVPLDKFRWQFEVNVDGQLAVTQAFLPLVRRARRQGDHDQLDRRSPHAAVHRSTGSQQARAARAH